jgi:hypothetical protein
MAAMVLGSYATPHSGRTDCADVNKLGASFWDRKVWLGKMAAHFTINSAKVQWDMLLPDHGAIAMDKAYLDVQKDLDLVALLLGEGRDVPGVPFALPEYRKHMYGRPPVTLP